jgi:hypothetical protein
VHESDLSPETRVISEDAPEHWLGTTPLLDLEDPKLRLRAQALTQLCKNEREKALAVYGYVKRIPFAKPFKMRLHTAREVLDAPRGDAADKAALLIALLRLVNIPARLRYVQLRGEILRGLTSNMAAAARAQAEVWLNGHWVRTDTYIFDAAYMAAARQRLREQDWEWGMGIHRDGHTLWDGVNDSYISGSPDAQDAMFISDLGNFCDPLEFTSSDIYRQMHPRMSRALHWNMLSPLMERAIRDLREESAAGATPAARKTSA